MGALSGPCGYPYTGEATGEVTTPLGAATHRGPRAAPARSPATERRRARGTPRPDLRVWCLRISRLLEQTAPGGPRPVRWECGQPPCRMLLAAPVARAPQGGALLGRDIRVLTRC